MQVFSKTGIGIPQKKVTGKLKPTGGAKYAAEFDRLALKGE